MNNNQTQVGEKNPPLNKFDCTSSLYKLEKWFVRENVGAGKLRLCRLALTWHPEEPPGTCLANLSDLLICSVRRAKDGLATETISYSSLYEHGHSSGQVLGPCCCWVQGPG